MADDMIAEICFTAEWLETVSAGARATDLTEPPNNWQAVKCVAPTLKFLSNF